MHGWLAALGCVFWFGACVMYAAGAAVWLWQHMGKHPPRPCYCGHAKTHHHTQAGCLVRHDPPRGDFCPCPAFVPKPSSSTRDQMRPASDVAATRYSSPPVPSRYLGTDLATLGRYNHWFDPSNTSVHIPVVTGGWSSSTHLEMDRTNAELDLMRFAQRYNVPADGFVQALNRRIEARLQTGTLTPQVLRAIVVDVKADIARVVSAGQASATTNIPSGTTMVQGVGCPCPACTFSAIPMQAPQMTYDQMRAAIANAKRITHPEEIPATDLPRSEQTDVIVGWRAWKAERVDGEYVLVSVTMGTRWQPGIPLEANVEPTSGRTRGHGIYACKSLIGACEAMHDWPSHIIGQVSLWGTVIEHERGYRAQFAYPLVLYTEHEEIAQSLRRRYGIEVSARA